MTIPLPGAGVLYSALKDFWGWASTRLRGRRLTPEVFRGWTVDEWHSPNEAIEKFGDPAWIRRRAEDAEEARRKGQELNASLRKLPPKERDPVVWQRHMEEVHRLYEAGTNVLLEELGQKLLHGELIARAFREPFAAGAPYVPISRHEWRVLEVKPSDRAEGGGVGYVALTIGKPGTKRLLRRRR